MTSPIDSFSQTTNLPARGPIITTMLLMTRQGERNPDEKSSRWLVYVGVALLALGVGALVYASIISYLNAIL